MVPVNDLASQLLPGLVSLPVSSDVSWHLLSLVDAVLGAIVGASFIYGAGAIYLRARGVEGMGFGDVKLMAMIGAFLGAKLTIFTLFSASIAGSLFGVSTVLAVWIKRTRRRMKRNHESAARGAAAGLGIGRDRAAPPSNAIWRLSRRHGHGRVVLRQQFPALVLGVAVRLATNPIVLRMVLVFVAAGFAFIVGLLLMRRMRRSISEEGSFSDTPSSVSVSESFPLHTYHAVIQQLKQQKHELQSLQLLERRRAKTSENISAAVLSNLSSGVLFFTPNGLVRQANASAKQILGFASPAGMSAAEIFREAKLISASDGSFANLAEAVNVSLREKNRFQRLEAQLSHSRRRRTHPGYHGEFGACARQ